MFSDSKEEGKRKERSGAGLCLANQPMNFSYIQFREITATRSHQVIFNPARYLCPPD